MREYGLSTTVLDCCKALVRAHLLCEPHISSTLQYDTNVITAVKLNLCSEQQQHPVPVILLPVCTTVTQSIQCETLSAEQ
jgi:hypothetical protein